MPAWRFYKREALHYGKNPLYNIPILSRDRVEVFIKAICDKYELPYPKISYRGIKFHSCNRKKDRITFIPDDITVGVLAHEMGHYYTKYRSGHLYHNEELMGLVGTLLCFLDDFVMDEHDRLGVKHPYRKSMIVEAE